MEPWHRYWKFIHHLVLKENARILDISPDKKQVWLEMKIRGRKAAVRVAKVEYDWLKQVDTDIEQAGRSFKRIKRMIIGKNIAFYNIYISSYPPVDLHQRLQEQSSSAAASHVYFLSRDPISANLDPAENVLQDLAARESWHPLIQGPETDHEQYARFYRKRVQERQEKLEQEDRSLLLFSRSKVVFLFLAAILLVFIWMERAGESTNILTLIEYGAKYNPAILEGEWWRLFTSMFLHIGMLHLVMNSLALFYIGGAVERMYGMWRFTVIYFTAGIFGSLASFAFNEQVSAGASGAIFGCFGALLYFGLIHRSLFFRTMGLNVLVIIAINLAFGFAVPAVDNGAHIGGLAGGFLAAAMVHLPRHGWRLAQIPAFLVIPALAGGLGWYGTINDEKSEAAMIDVQLAQEYLQRDNVEEARRLLRDILADEENPYAYFVLGNTYLQESHYEQAAASYESAVAQNPELAEAHYNLSIAYLELQQPQKAKRALQRAKELNIEEQEENINLDRLESELEAARN